MILGLSGLAGSGKDFIADLFVKKYGFVKIAFADPVKRICQEIFDFSDEQLWGPSEERNKPDLRYIRSYIDASNVLSETGLEKCPDGEILQYLTPRHTLQQLGTDFGRNCYSNVWVDYTFRVIDKLMKGSYQYSVKKGLIYEDGLKPPVGIVIPDLKPPVGIVIPDLRFLNEMYTIRSKLGKIVRIINDEKNSLSSVYSQHISETEQQSIPDYYFDYVLHNKRDPVYLNQEINKIFNLFIK